ncbi:MAG: DUF429 domain-containing protein [Gammaproteobacteria bacterium]
MKLAGIDLAWVSGRNPSAIAIGHLEKDRLRLERLEHGVFGVDGLVELMRSSDDIKGVAVDASLIINNPSGQRRCERELARVYASRGAACHASNLKLYPDPDSVSLSRRLQALGFRHLSGERWQIECYPHPALIELFALPKRLAYKKGKVDQRRAGQIQLAEMIKGLSGNARLKLEIPQHLMQHLSPVSISEFRGKALKANEDKLDAMVCLYIAGLFAMDAPGRLFGDASDGYIWVPLSQSDA